jgi:hypothetical protein
VTRRWFRSVLVTVAVLVLLTAGSAPLAAPASAASAGRSSIAAAPRCSSGAVAAGLAVNPLDGTAACAAGPTNDAQRDEAALAGAGILVLAGAAVLYRRRRPRGPRGVGPPAPQG